MREACSLTRVESAVMALWDANVSIECIAARLRMPRGSVQTIVSKFDGRADARIARAKMAKGCARLARAILKARAA